MISKLEGVRTYYAERAKRVASDLKQTRYKGAKSREISSKECISKLWESFLTDHMLTLRINNSNLIIYWVI